MNHTSNRREFLKTSALAGAGLSLPAKLVAPSSKSLLVFTKSSGFEHAAVKRDGDKLSVCESTATAIGKKYGFDVFCTKDGRIFDSADFAKFNAMLFFTTGNLTLEGTDKNPPMSVAGKQKMLDSIKGGVGFIGVHAASDTFHTEPDSPDLSSRYVAYGEKSDPYIRMLGGEFIIHGHDPRLQTAALVVNDPKFPGLEGVHSPVELNEEWYSLKDFAPDLHVILTVDTTKLKNPCYQRRPYPGTWSRMHGKGRVFYTNIGDRLENWQDPFFINLLTGGTRFALGEVEGSTKPNLKEATPGYADIPPQNPKKS
ncbi:MAG TPA: ThuA domain-containing protein [Dongiaceae bacterium]|nr:ThuA domain-containing protein [Dongiaceae bacterium]